ncbi:unnamed protein product [Porites evermanni]|uniref:Uncharacterized protein n=1 Tax=Porites evermanni TaxID=104178 RepID=A0ABN8MLU8_9CNID|nr:unnamed protein product [Porites evermanni]
MPSGIFAAFFICFMLNVVLGVVGEKVSDNQGLKDTHEELFNGRIEAPNKTYILENLFKGYDKRVRPYYRENPVNVTLYAVIDSFHDIKEEQMEYKVEVVLKENWKDPRLAYGNASWFVRLKGNTLAKVWYPDTMIENSRKHEVDDKTRTIYLFGDGTIFMSEWIKGTLSSHMEFHSYPMDVQTLRIQFAAYSYDDNQVMYRWSKVSLTEKDMTEFYVVKEILRLEATSFITGTHTAAIAEFQIRRRLQYYIMEFYFPCTVCTIASWIQFWMDVTAIGDRAGLGITTVLTEIFLLQFSSQGMPKVSYMKAAELYVVVSFGFIFMALLESALAFKASYLSIERNKQAKEREEKGDKFKKRSSVHNRTTRNNEKFEIPLFRSATGQRTFAYRAVSLWNTLDEDLRNATTVKAFKKALKLIDIGARVIFPLTYAGFVIGYFYTLI